MGKQALKSIKNNVDIVPRCRRQQSGVRLLRVLSTAAKQGLKLSRFEGYRRYGAKNARGHFERRGATWEVYRAEKERSLPLVTTTKQEILSSTEPGFIGLLRGNQKFVF